MSSPAESDISKPVQIIVDQPSDDWFTGDDIDGQWDSSTEASDYEYDSDGSEGSRQRDGNEVDAKKPTAKYAEAAQPDKAFDDFITPSWEDDPGWTPLEPVNIQWDLDGNDIVDNTRPRNFWIGPSEEEVAAQERQQAEWEEQAPARRAAWEDVKKQRAPHIMIDQSSELVELLSLLEECTGEPKVVVDIEGFNEYRQECDILEIYLRDFDQLYLLDFYTMGEGILKITTPTGFSLHHYLSSAKHPKIFWDARQDANAMFISYDIKLAGVIDASLMLPRLKMRNAPYETHRVSVEEAIDDVLVKKHLICPEEYDDLTEGKRERMRLAPEAWTIRPLPSALLEYACDVRLMGMMYHKYLAPAYEKLPGLLQFVLQGTDAEIDYACSPLYSRTSCFGACTPWSAPDSSVPHNWRSMLQNSNDAWFQEKMELSIRQRRAQKHIKDLERYRPPRGDIISSTCVDLLTPGSV